MTDGPNTIFRIAKTVHVTIQRKNLPPMESTKESHSYFWSLPDALASVGERGLGEHVQQTPMTTIRTTLELERARCSEFRGYAGPEPYEPETPEELAEWQETYLWPAWISSQRQADPALSCKTCGTTIDDCEELPEPCCDGCERS